MNLIKKLTIFTNASSLISRNCIFSHRTQYSTISLKSSQSSPSLPTSFYVIRQFHVTSINKEDDNEVKHDRIDYELSPIFREKAGKLLKLESKPSDKEADKVSKKKFTEHRYSTMNFRISPRKLNFLGRQIANKPLDEAIRQMEFSHKKASKKIMHSLITAKHHAKEYKHLDTDNCYIEQAWVGKGYYRKKANYAARGRMSFMLIKKSHMKYIIKEKKVNLKEEEEGIKRKRKYKGFNYERKKVWMPLIENKPIYNPPRFYNW